ncbi:hypothetical protein MSTO_23430 [Mycobacterium stomatepiae]|uniref:Hemerythrin n=1 Tax=Mycobacterium stomatepiae TaxID=470076 RepID=A0A7I7Q738_9MYCO|nr:hypothetical protein MSTO_23430 [Mycobacterium stomatepiae]
MDALTFLRQDHKSVLGMFEVLDGAPSDAGSQVSGLKTMVTNLVIAESQHEAIEEHSSGLPCAVPSKREMLWRIKQFNKSRPVKSSCSN